MTPSRRRRSFDFRQFERAGESSIPDSNGTLPRAQERVQQAIEAEALVGVWGPAPRQDEGAAWSPGARRLGQLPRSGRYGQVSRNIYSPAKRLGVEELSRLRYRAPARTLVCAQRGVRREVLFARRVAGFKRSPGRGGKYHRRQESQYGC